jgi:tetratricopeptide (TPR) repeat protein
VPSAQDNAEAQQRIREANLLRMRGQLAAAERELMRAIELSPSDAQAFEMLGDIQRQAGRSADALGSYTRASELPAAPGSRAALESKMARMALERDQGSFGSLENAALLSGNVVLPLVSSAVMPGVGQMLMGRYVRGGIVFVVWVTSLILAFTLPQTRDVIDSIKAQLNGVPQVSSGHLMLTLLLLLINVATWIYGMVDAAIMARRS